MALPCFCPNKIKLRQNGRRFKENEEPMFTLTCQDRHGILLVGLLDIKGTEQIRRVYNINGTSPCLNTMQGGNKQPKVMIDYKIRKLTPRECWRLMGFKDEQFEIAQNINSNSQLYKQAGNSIVVNVMEEIFRNLLKE